MTFEADRQQWQNDQAECKRQRDEALALLRDGVRRWKSLTYYDRAQKLLREAYHNERR